MPHQQTFPQHAPGSIPRSGSGSLNFHVIAAVVIALLLVFCTVGFAYTEFSEEDSGGGRSFRAEAPASFSSTPRGHMVINGNPDYFYSTTVQTMDSTGLRVSEAEYFLVDPEGNTAAYGSVIEIYGLNRDDPGVNLTFNDVNLDGKISANDNFQLKGTGNGGVCGSGYTFTLKFTGTDDVVMKQTTP